MRPSPRVAIASATVGPVASTPPSPSASVQPGLGVDVTVILTPPCIFYMENH
jgi:hypothetical protein